MTNRLFVPGRPDPVKLQAAAIRQELAMGRLALRVLAILLSKEKDRKVTIKKEAWNRLNEKLPGAMIRFGEEAERVTARLATPDELDALDRKVARETAERKEAVESVAVALEAQAKEAPDADA